MYRITPHRFYFPTPWRVNPYAIDDPFMLARIPKPVGQAYVSATTGLGPPMRFNPDLHRFKVDENESGEFLPLNFEETEKIKKRYPKSPIPNRAFTGHAHTQAVKDRGEVKVMISNSVPGCDISAKIPVYENLDENSTVIQFTVKIDKKVNVDFSWTDNIMKDLNISEQLRDDVKKKLLDNDSDKALIFLKVANDENGTFQRVAKKHKFVKKTVRFSDESSDSRDGVAKPLIGNFFPETKTTYNMPARERHLQRKIKLYKELQLNIPKVVLIKRDKGGDHVKKEAPIKKKKKIDNIRVDVGMQTSDLEDNIIKQKSKKKKKKRKNKKSDSIDDKIEDLVKTSRGKSIIKKDNDSSISHNKVVRFELEAAASESDVETSRCYPDEKISVHVESSLHGEGTQNEESDIKITEDYKVDTAYAEMQKTLLVENLTKKKKNKKHKKRKKKNVDNVDEKIVQSKKKLNKDKIKNSLTDNNDHDANVSQDKVVHFENEPECAISDAEKSDCNPGESSTSLNVECTQNDASVSHDKVVRFEYEQKSSDSDAEKSPCNPREKKSISLEEETQNEESDTKVTANLKTAMSSSSLESILPENEFFVPITKEESKHLIALRTKSVQSGKLTLSSTDSDDEESSVSLEKSKSEARAMKKVQRKKSNSKRMAKKQEKQSMIGRILNTVRSVGRRLHKAFKFNDKTKPKTMMEYFRLKKEKANKGPINKIRQGKRVGNLHEYNDFRLKRDMDKGQVFKPLKNYDIMSVLSEPEQANVSYSSEEELNARKSSSAPDVVGFLYTQKKLTTRQLQFKTFTTWLRYKLKFGKKEVKDPKEKALKKLEKEWAKQEKKINKRYNKEMMMLHD